MLPLQGTWVQSLVREVRSHLPLTKKKKKKKKFLKDVGEKKQTQLCWGWNYSNETGLLPFWDLLSNGKVIMNYALLIYFKHWEKLIWVW